MNSLYEYAYKMIYQLSVVVYQIYIQTARSVNFIHATLLWITDKFFFSFSFFPSSSLFYFSILSIREYIYIYMFYFSSFFFFFFYMYYIAYFRWFSPNEVGIRGENLDADHVCNYYSRENGYLFNAFGVTVSIITSRIF